MNIYLAPLEGITGWIYRGAVQKCFGGFDKYFIPFIKPNQMGRFSAREKKDILPEHNKGMHAVPQILTNCAEDFVQTAKKLEQYGYKEINLNVGLVMQHPVQFLLICFYMLLLFGLVITGIIFWAINFKKFKCAPGEITIPKGKRFSTIILNVGMILYCLFWIIQIILQLFA